MEEIPKKRKSRKQIVFNVTEDDHQLIKRIVLDKKMTMREWIINAMADAIRKDQQQSRDSA